MSNLVVIGFDDESKTEAMNRCTAVNGTMSDTRSIELKGLEYVLDRLPRGFEECNRFVLIAQEDLEGTSFAKIQQKTQYMTLGLMNEKNPSKVKKYQ